MYTDVRSQSFFNRISNLVLKFYDHGEYVRVCSLEGIEDNLPIVSRYELDNGLKRLTKDYGFIHIQEEHYYLNINLVKSIRRGTNIDGKPVCYAQPRFYVKGVKLEELELPIKYFPLIQKALHIKR
ncbi:hypothetical protein CUN59_00395 [Cuspidothrix issatschenkoi CHARLIE-1]|uniref:Uncharacterized protein n=1 Tax=Cuspidothrix issatschenkoi CHARLIE-1 TaxID=2052836 RepID=A0A2S6D065_9CYAN|nr:hypothetical protein CUN59_00395 [Cuspidothrix issatschenkoi CHARLIE-1]